MKIEIYSKKKCHLCDVMINTVKECIKEIKCNTEFKVINIDSDPELNMFSQKIPVLMIDGRMFAKYEVDKDRLKNKMIRNK